ncbi:hypothetical protein CDAR_468301 [Caerostris darwini]|uniref:Uncharacterized protein n=1 Tax=Caerostris darwini TaxID=1538125 RepID=A0AAV4WWN6_9ARAC|nr:hypothetical protein CDAR_468301 [Caerostris darwini]
MHDPSPIAPFHRGDVTPPPPNIEVISHRRQSTPTRVTPPWTLCGRMFSSHSLPHHTSTLLPSQGNTRFLLSLSFIPRARSHIKYLMNGSQPTQCIQVIN